MGWGNRGGTSPFSAFLPSFSFSALETHPGRLHSRVLPPRGRALADPSASFLPLYGLQPQVVGTLGRNVRRELGDASILRAVDIRSLIC